MKRNWSFVWTAPARSRRMSLTTATTSTRWNGWKMDKYRIGRLWVRQLPKTILLLFRRMIISVFLSLCRLLCFCVFTIHREFELNQPILSIKCGKINIWKRLPKILHQTIIFLHPPHLSPGIPLQPFGTMGGGVPNRSPKQQYIPPKRPIFSREKATLY